MIFSLVVGASLFVEIVKHPVVLKLGNSPAMYRAALINHSLGISAFTFASSFSHFDTLKRINMMSKPASGSAKKLAAIVVLPAMALFFWAFARPKVKLITPNKYSTTRSVEAAAKDEAIAKKRKIKPNKLSPLVYLDGVEIESPDNVNPEDIESIDVIKDKTAIALYGEKGKNGVILITSKKLINLIFFYSSIKASRRRHD
jgi:TonB-dependent SusC/RagA subfamily outer membrane receptor